MLHKNICTSEKLSTVSMGAECLFYRLLTVVDDYGRFWGNPATIKDACLPLRTRNASVTDVKKWLFELVDVGLIHRYEVDRAFFVEIIRFSDFQILRNDVKKWADFPSPKRIRNEHVTNTERKRSVEVEDKAEVEVEHTHSEIACVSENSFNEIWEAYPNKDGRKAAERHFHASVKTPKDFEDIKCALKNYLSSDKVQRGFVKNGSTWFNNWRDWVNYKPPTQGMRMLAAAQSLQDTLERTYANAK